MSNADQAVSDQLNGGPDGQPAFPEAIAAMLYPARLFGLAKDYANPEGPNSTPSRYSQITTLTKLLTRTHVHVDGNTYDAWDCLQTITKWILTQSPTINSDEINSANYVKPVAK